MEVYQRTRAIKCVRGSSKGGQIPNKNAVQHANTNARLERKNVKPPAHSDSGQNPRRVSEIDPPSLAQQINQLKSENKDSLKGKRRMTAPVVLPARHVTQPNAKIPPATTAHREEGDLSGAGCGVRDYEVKSQRLELSGSTK